jgi:hypothetical protein
MKYLDDLLIFCGCGLVLYATYLLSFVAALYVGGFMFILVGFFVGMTGKRGEK